MTLTLMALDVACLCGVSQLFKCYAECRYAECGGASKMYFTQVGFGLAPRT